MTDFAWLDEIEKRLEAATHGPWLVNRRDQDWGDVDFVVEDERMRAIAFCQEFAIPTCKLNAEFIAHSPTDIAKLIETVKVMRAALLLVEKTYDDDCKEQIVKKALEEVTRD